MFNAILFNKGSKPSRSLFYEAVTSVVGDTYYDIQYKNGSAMITIGDQIYSCIYIDQPIPGINGNYTHEAHLIVSCLNTPKSMEEGVYMQQGVLRVVMMLIIQTDQTYVYWSNSKKVCDADKVNLILENYNDILEGRVESISNNLPIAFWLDVERENDSCARVIGLNDLGGIDVEIFLSIKKISVMSLLINQLLKYLFDTGVQLKDNDCLKFIPDMEFKVSKGFGESVLIISDK